MTKPFTLQPLVNLAHKKNDAAMQKFGKLNQQEQAALAKLDTLLQYRKDYQTRYHEAVQTGISHSDLSNFQNFMARLDEAIAQQQKIVEQIHCSVETGRNEMQDASRKMKSFDTLSQRHIEKERKVEAKSEQRLQDELSGRHAAFKGNPSQGEN